MRVLVVDDDEVLLRTNVAALEQPEFDAVPARSGEEALQLLATGPFDALLIDLMMPNLNGIDVIRLLKSRQPNLRIVLTSAFAVSSGQLDRMGLERVEFVSKSASKEELLAVLRGAPSRPRTGKHPVAPRS